MPSWICRAVVCVVVIRPAFATGWPDWLNTAVLARGGAKFGWLRTLKASTRICARTLPAMAMLL